MKLSLYLFTAANAKPIFQFVRIRLNCYEWTSLMLEWEKTCYCISGPLALGLCVLYCFDLILEFERKNSLRYIGLLENTNKQQGLLICFEMDTPPKSHWEEGWCGLLLLLSWHFNYSNPGIFSVTSASIENNKVLDLDLMYHFFVIIKEKKRSRKCKIKNKTSKDSHGW